jgi:Ca2+-binding EF-hand superfamily protein
MNKHDLATGYGFNEDQIGSYMKIHVYLTFMIVWFNFFIQQVFEETFQIFDKDCDGFITPIEIRTVMNSLGFFPNDEKIRKGIEDIDNDSKFFSCKSS